MLGATFIGKETFVFDVQDHISDHEDRIRAIESRAEIEATNSERLIILKKRVDVVGSNLLIKIDKRADKLEGELADIKSMLLSLGATAPADRVNQT
jgi:hypothetical protein